jgi:adenine-specific DNA-methyltransferase
MESTDGKSLDIKKINIEKLKALFPEAISEDKVDWERLKASIGEEYLAFENERYVLNWAGKADAFRVLQAPTTATLSPSPEDSVNFDTTQNVFIEGENLEVLKVLQKSYFGKVKMIYIDPPYNTGSDSFIYPDKFSESKEDYLRRIGEKDEEGFLMKEGFFRKNAKENGHFHSNWLNMMYPRLYLARNLMRDDGVIFVSIGNDEVHNLKLLMNEVFGEENFVECLIWNKLIQKNDTGIGNIHEYVLIYLKQNSSDYKFLMPKEGLEEINDLLASLKKKKTPIPEAEAELKKLYEKKGYDRGITLYNALDKSYLPWGKINLSWPNADTFGPRYEVLHPITNKPTRIPDRGWRWKRETFEKHLNYKDIIELHDGSFVCGKIWFAKDEKTQPSLVKYLHEVDNLLLRSILSLKSDGGIELESIFEGKSIFSYPKPTALIKMLINSFELSDGDIVLDFFAGSGTTGHAVLDINNELNKRIKYLLIQLREPLDKTNENSRAVHQAVSQICIERLKKATGSFDSEGHDPNLFSNEKRVADQGIKTFMLKSSNFKIWRNDMIETEDDLNLQLSMFEDPVKVGAQERNVLWELILKAGYELTVPVVEKGTLWSVASDELVIGLRVVNESVLEEAIAMKPRRAIFLDRLFEGKDEMKTNARLQMRDAGIEFKTI